MHAHPTAGHSKSSLSAMASIEGEAPADDVDQLADDFAASLKKEKKKKPKKVFKQEIFD